mgnify:CR=1 FL=1
MEKYVKPSIVSVDLVNEEIVEHENDQYQIFRDCRD